MCGHVHPDADDEGRISVEDLVESVGRGRVIRFAFPPGRAYARRLASDEYQVLRVNENRAYLDTHTVTRHGLVRAVERGVESGEGVVVESYQELWPSRFRGDRR